MKTLVVEGPDNAGKSTLTLRLAKDLKAVAVNSQVVPPPHEYWVKDYVRWLDEAQKWNQQIILDRHPVISEPIYGPVIRGKCSLSEAYCREVRRSLIVVYCRPPYDVIANFGDRPQMAGVKECADLLVADYDALLRDRAHEFAAVLLYDWTRNAYPIFLNMLKGVLRG